MSISLMSNIPHNSIVRSIKNVMQSYGQFHSSQTRGKVPRIARKLINDILPKFFTYFRKQIYIEFAKIPRTIYAIK